MRLFLRPFLRLPLPTQANLLASQNIPCPPSSPVNSAKELGTGTPKGSHSGVETPTQERFSCFHSTDGETEAREGLTTCQRSQGGSGTRLSLGVLEGAELSPRFGVSILAALVHRAAGAAPGREAGWNLNTAQNTGRNPKTDGRIRQSPLLLSRQPPWPGPRQSNPPAAKRPAPPIFRDHSPASYFRFRLLRPPPASLRAARFSGGASLPFGLAHLELCELTRGPLRMCVAKGSAGSQSGLLSEACCCRVREEEPEA